MKRILAIIAALAATPAAAEDPCPFSEVRGLWRNFRPLSQLMIAVTYRRECGVMDGRDRTAIRSIHLDRGCPVASGLGDYFTDFLEAPLAEWNRHPGIALIRRGDPVGYHGFCRMAQALPWPEGSASFLLTDPAQMGPEDSARQAAFWAHLDAMQTELTWLLKQ